jgi:hypothetical protein
MLRERERVCVHVRALAEAVMLFEYDKDNRTSN